MNNLEYLKESKEARNKELKAMNTITKSAEFEKIKIEMRKMYALEIIAEELCKLNKEVK